MAADVEAYQDTLLNEYQRIARLREFIPTATYDEMQATMTGFTFSALPAVRAKDAAIVEAKDEAKALREKVKKTIDYRSVTMKLSSSNPGATQTAYIATYDNAEMNTHRNVMLKLETPLAYNLGTLVYSLKSINRIKQ